MPFQVQFTNCPKDEIMSDQGSSPHSELDHISDDETNVSDKDYRPESESPDEDSDASIPFTSTRKDEQTMAEPVIPSAGTSYGSDASTPVRPSTSKGLPLPEDHFVPNGAETSDMAKKIIKGNQ